MTFLQIDLPAMLVAVLAALAAALVGNVLVLRRQAMMGDALSHMVLPGIVIAFMVTGAAQSWVTPLGALVAGLVGAGLIALIRRLGRMDAATAMGVVLTTLFAIGVLLLEAADAGNVHLDVEHALYGSLESAIWLWPTAWPDVLDPAGWRELPREVPLLTAAVALLGALFLLCFKEIRLIAFDPDYAAAQGLPRWLTEGAVNAAAAIAVVAAFDAVGSILVIAMLICPAGAARLLTDSFGRQIWLSLCFAVAIAVSGYAAAVWGAPAAGAPGALNAAGVIAIVGGLCIGAASAGRSWRQRRHS